LSKSSWSSGLTVSRFTVGAEDTSAAASAKPETANRPGAVVIDQEWRRWVAENVLRQCEPKAIVDAMVHAGVDAESATREVQAAMGHPYIRAARQFAIAPAGVPGNPDAKIRKREWVLECYRRSNRLASGFDKVTRVPKLPRQKFLDEYYALNRPVVMTGALTNWPAMRRWTGPELKRRFGDRVVSVQANRESDPNYERNSVKLRTEMTFGEFVDIVESGVETNNYYITANNDGKNREALGELWADIVLLRDYLRDDPKSRGFFWFGPKGTVTPLHHDLTNNFMAQVRGRKRVRLIAPWNLAYLYNDRHCFTGIDLENPDYDRFPMFRDVPVLDVTIGPGDLLFLPVGWWHHVRSLDVSITMTFTNFAFDNDFCSFYTTYEDI